MVAIALLTLMRTENSLVRLVRLVVGNHGEVSRSDPKGSLADFPLYYEDIPDNRLKLNKRGKTK